VLVKSGLGAVFMSLLSVFMTSGLTLEWRLR
jgi:hypothetical protein